jgi:hypothetical protein
MFRAVAGIFDVGDVCDEGWVSCLAFRRRKTHRRDAEGAENGAQRRAVYPMRFEKSVSVEVSSG